jgi:hypothetical protein
MTAGRPSYGQRASEGCSGQPATRKTSSSPRAHGPRGAARWVVPRAPTSAPNVRSGHCMKLRLEGIYTSC